MATSPILLILGAGSNVGQSVAKTFAAKGYKIALAARKLNESESTEDTINIQSDFSDPNSVAKVFEKVKEKLGVPSVVVYNAAAVTFADAKSPLGISVADFTKDLTINTISTYIAAQQAVQGFDELPDSASKTFIYTGNALNTMIIPSLITLGVGKSATAHVIEVAAKAYGDRGVKFYFADERQADGQPVYSGVDGDAHAQHFLQLAEGKTQLPWQQTFVKGAGYKKFSVA